MNANIQYHNEAQSGYGRFGLRTVEALEKLGLTNLGDLGTTGPGVDPSVIAEERKDVPLARCALWLSTPPHVKGWYKGQHATIFTMWESTEIPPALRENLHHFDRVIVPSVQNLELFSRYHDDVRYVPLAVDSSWRFTYRTPVGREFRFLTCGYGPRKGVTQVARAFNKVFGPGKGWEGKGGPVPKLICKSRDDVGGPGISRITQTLSMSEELNLYENAHCYVSGSKGEGWGFFPHQAIQQGIPTILGDAHGHHEFAHYGIPIDTHPYECKGATFWGDGGEWWEPDFDQMCEAMWDVYSNYARYTKQAEQAAHSIRHQFTWEKTAERIIYNLADVLDDGVLTERVWEGKDPARFLVRVNKHCKFVINGRTHAFEPGRDYYESAELRRAVLAAGHFDMEVFDPHALGLEDGDILEEVKAHNERCPTCHQRYNSDPSLAELRV